MQGQLSNVVLFPDIVQEELFEILDEIFDFAMHYYSRTIVNKMERLIEGMNISKEEGERIFQQLFFWQTFCSPIGLEQITIYQRYLLRNKANLRKRNVTVQEVLVKWLHLNPGFYMVENTDHSNGKVFILNDLFEGNSKLTYINSKNTRAPKRGEMITGMLFPMAGDYYIALKGILHIPIPLVKKVSSKIIPHYEINATSVKYKSNPQLYPSLLQITLDILGEV
ncbi:hypothetical protein [Oceanobacillus bengalensis]|uniref:Uncharacterized protein n=1 Tax=Oceanobacillus bengalensis TaxID=1435466 RepID=A0A494Z814_9BACI|nr:hypothetical protein [Oceanobacillus bengalensis]RKQ18656.1 hypothetical protein D8M05_00645 [Oceanobacillus bengalensis]